MAALREAAMQVSHKLLEILKNNSDELRKTH